MRQEFRPLAYSDGLTQETLLRKAVEECQDVSASSVELAGRIIDWPTEYHFSRTRHNLIRFIKFTREDRVLELGAGCGAMTRYLGEQAGHVIAVEGSRRRAEIAAARCRDQDNVSICCDSISQLKLDGRFDYVTLIGVLEYSPCFIDAAEPALACLQSAASHLTDQGTLVLAIENQFGLKYFSGCSEDHLGIPYFGIQGLYGKKTPVTFGRLELKNLLNRAGFESVEFYYPFPDYKLPSLLFSEDAFTCEQLNLGDLLIRHESRDYSGGTVRAFNESLAWHSIARNGLAQDLANSFLVLASPRQRKSPRGPSWFARSYSDNRRRCFSTETIIHPTDADGIKVEKRRMYPESLLPADSALGVFWRGEDSTHFIQGQLLDSDLRRQLALGGTVETLMPSFSAWNNELLKISVRGTNGERLIPAFGIDLIPRNFIVGAQGSLSFFDTEWQFASSIPHCLILIRGIAYSVIANRYAPGLSGKKVKDIVISIAARLGCEIREEHLMDAVRIEDELQDFVQDFRASSFQRVLDYSLPIRDPSNYVTLIQQAEEEAKLWKDHAQRIKATASWQLTKPLRFLSYLMKKL
jgi:SAM-dependent methyltransferase